MTADAYTLSVIRQDFTNHLGTPPIEDRPMLAGYLDGRAEVRRSHDLVYSDDLYVNTDPEIRALIQRIAA